MAYLTGLMRHPPLRFLFCGGLAALVNWLVRFPLSLFLPFWAAVIGALAIGMVFGFYLYRRLVWPQSNQPLLRTLARFILVNLVNALAILIISTALLSLLKVFAMPEQLAQASAHAIGIAAGAVLNYLGHSRFTFA